MRKKLLGITALAAALTLATGMTSFAAGWVQDANGWGWQRDDGTWQPMGWFTDPNTGYEYYFDPDGYMMSGTRVEGYWLDDNGIKHEKTEAEIQAEEEREKQLASRPSPGQQQSAAKQAGKAAKNATTAVTTTRLSYQAEMKTFMDTVFTNAAKEAREIENRTASSSTTTNNLETTYRFLSKDRGIFLTSTLWLNSLQTSPDYTPYAYELMYNRSVLEKEEEKTVFTSAYNKLLVAALGETEGNAVYERVMAEEVGNGASFDQSGATDTGNTYDLTYRDGVITVKVTCSEADAAAAAAEKAAQAEAAQEEQAVTSSVITAGQGAVQADETEAASDETTEEAAEDEATAEEAAAEDSSEETAE